MESHKLTDELISEFLSLFKCFAQFMLIEKHNAEQCARNYSYKVWKLKKN